MCFLLSEFLLVTYLTLIYLFITPPSLPRALDWSPNLIPVLSSRMNWLAILSRCFLVLQVMGKIFCVKLLSLVEASLSYQFFLVCVN